MASIDLVKPAEPVTAITPFTRAVFVVGVCLTIGTGIALFAAPARTSTYWAWTIKAPLTAAFFGAGYIGAAVGLAWAACERTWRCARIIAVLAFTLTTLALVDTLRDLGGFSFHRGGFVEVAAWSWLAVYVALPPLVLAAFVQQELRGGARDDDAELPALVATRLVSGGAGAALAVFGVLLLVPVSSLADRWPWPLPTLPAAVVGAWLCTIAAGLLWFAVREPEWQNARAGVVPMVASLVLDLVAAGRLHGGFRGTVAPTLYVAGVAVLVAVVATAAIVEERRLRGHLERDG